MIMSNFIDEAERHAELYGVYSSRQLDILKIVNSLNGIRAENDQLTKRLHESGINDSEIAWLKRTGHVLPVYRL